MRKTGIYTFKNICSEDTSILLNDEAIKVIVNVNGTIGNISNELKAVLQYIDKGIANTEYTKSLDVAVERVKNDEKWRRDYMTLYMRDMENQEIGEKIGELANTISLIRRNRNQYSEDMLSNLCNLSKAEYQNIIFYINNDPDLDAKEIAEKLLDNEE